MSRTPPRFTAREYRALVQVLGYYAEQAAEPGWEAARPDLLAADRAVAKVRASLTPAQLRDAEERMGK